MRAKRKSFEIMVRTKLWEREIVGVWESGDCGRVATFAMASAFAEVVADKSATEERVENAEPRRICRGSGREAGAGRQWEMAKASVD